MRALFFGSVLLMAGCIFNNISSEERLRDSVVGLNDETRWNRIDLATQRVLPAYRAEFRVRHHDWHRAMQIADSEIIHVVIPENREEAISIVTVRWYDQRTMLLSETTIRQRWERIQGTYVMADEEVTDGNPSLLEIPEALREAFEGSTPVPEPEVEAEAHANSTIPS